MDTIEQSYWDESYNNFDYFIPKNDAITKFLDEHVKNIQDKTVFEIGCFPLRYLSYLGKKGAVVSGVDLTPEIQSKKLTDWLTNENIKFENLYHADYTKLIESKKQYDIVISMGFVEHFYNFDEVIKNHLPFLKKGGKLIITAPNFAGSIQKKLHTLYDYENLQRHHLPSMDIEKWKHILNDDVEITFANYFGRIDFWADKKKRSFLKKIGYFITKKIISISKKISFIFPNSKAYSPYLGIVAIKK